MTKIKLFIILIVGFFVIAQSVMASADITNAVLNGSGTVVSESGQKIIATVTVDLSGESSWKSTSYNFGDDKWVCVDTPDHFNGTEIKESFEIPVPTEVGTKKVNFKIFKQNNCTDNLGVGSATANLMGGFLKFFNDGNNWVIYIIIAIIIILLLFCIIKMIIGNKQSK